MRYHNHVICLVTAAFLAVAGPEAAGQSISSPFIRVGDTLYVSAAGNSDLETEHARGMEAATRQVMLNLEGSLAHGGFTFADVAFCEVWTTDLSKLEEVNKVYQEVFKSELPSGTITEVSALPGGSTLQIAMIAAKGRKRIIRPEGTQSLNLPFSPGNLVGDTLFISGQAGVDTQTGKLIEGDIKAHVAQALKHVGSILRAAELDFSNVVQANVFLTDPSDFGPMGEIYRSFTRQPRPARVPLGAIRLPLNAPVTITMLAKRHKGGAVLPPDMEPTDNYSRGLLVQNELYVAGIGSAKTSVDEGMDDALARVKKIIETAGMSMDVVQARIYLSDIRNLEAMGRGYRKYFGTSKPPTRVVVAVENLPVGLKIMTSFVAVREKR